MILFLLLLAAQVAGSLTYQPPAGWLRAVNPQTGLVTFAPPGVARNRSCAIAIFPAEAVTAPAQDYHNEMVRRATLNSRLLELPQRAGSGGVPRHRPARAGAQPAHRSGSCSTPRAGAIGDRR